MRTNLPAVRPARAQSGAAILIVLMVLALLGTLLLCTSKVLDGLERELHLLEEKQEKKFAPGSGAKEPVPGRRVEASPR